MDGEQALEQDEDVITRFDWEPGRVGDRGYKSGSGCIFGGKTDQIW